MHPHQIQKNNKGLSLIEVLVALGIFSVLSLAVAASVIHLFGLQKQVVTSDVGDNFSSAFFQHLLVPANCEAIIKNKTLPSGNSELDLDITTYQSMMPGASGGVKAGTIVDRGLSVNRVFARRKTGVPDGDLVQLGSSPTNDTYRRYTLQVILRLQRDDPKGGTPHTLPDRILEVPVLARAASPTQMFACMLESGAEEACLSLGGTYVSGKCDFPAECKVHGTFIKTNCDDPGVKCDPEYVGPDRNNPITGKENCPAGSCPTQSGRFTIVRSVQTGKKSWKDVKVTENFYICMSCPGQACN